jgi:hypothetical protein
VGVIPDWVHTDGAGRFCLEGLVPGCRYSLSVQIDGAVSDQSELFAGVVLAPGESRDLGDVQEARERRQPKP